MLRLAKPEVTFFSSPRLFALGSCSGLGPFDRRDWRRCERPLRGIGRVFYVPRDARGFIRAEHKGSTELQFFEQTLERLGNVIGHVGLLQEMLDAGLFHLCLEIGL